ncbi:prolyl oligopeptidase family serine peptidase [Rheinheimera texasensis]|uniref:S9 family peptidase n=1 Tax=Rheinheimera texasensis TaxID=306205 RepID=UPI0004E1D9D2|nr:S9 family peptidase [Rheinheimera texasensis]
MKAWGILVSALLMAAGAQAKTNLTIEHLNKLNKIYDVQVSPDGRFVAYGQKNGGLAPADTTADLYLLDVQDGNKVRRLTESAGREHDVRFSADGTALYFLADRSGSSQLWRLPLSGGEARQLTDLPLDVQGYMVSADDKKVVLTLDVKPGCKDLACTVAHNKATAEKKDSATAYDSLMVRHWDTWEDGLKNHFFVADLGETAIKDAKDLMPEWDTDVAGTGEAAFTPDGKNLVFSAKIPAADQSWHTNFDIFQVSLNGGQKINLTKDNPAWDAKPQFSGDGRYMAYLAMKKPVYEADRFGLILLDLVTGERKELAPQWDRSIEDFVFAPDNRTVYVTAQDLGQKGIFAIDHAFGEVSKIYSNGSAGDVAVRGSNVFFTNHQLNAPADIYQLKNAGGEAYPLTQVNALTLKDIQLAEFEQFSFPGANDETVYGYWMKPWNFEAGKKYPIAFIVHGGPQGSFGNMFNTRWNAQLWAAQGYGVVMIDFHGSTGYGQAFTDSIARDWGGKPLEDLKKGLAYVTEQQPWLDKDNACALGASYGGFMMNWIAGNWNDGFKCLVTHAGLFDMPSFYGSTEELWFPEHDMGGPVWDKSADYQKFNPAAFVDNWKTPMLVIHGLKDYRVPYAQGLGAYTTLQRKGIPSRLVIFPDENHWILKPANSERWYNEIFSWMKQYTAK